MERRSVLKLTGLAGILATGAAPAIVNAQENLRWRLASSFPEIWTRFTAAARFLQKKYANLAMENSIFRFVLVAN